MTRWEKVYYDDGTSFLLLIRFIGNSKKAFSVYASHRQLENDPTDNCCFTSFFESAFYGCFMLTKEKEFFKHVKILYNDVRTKIENSSIVSLIKYDTYVRRISNDTSH